MSIVHSPLFFRKIIEFERCALGTAIMDKCQNFLQGGNYLGGTNPNP